MKIFENKKDSPLLRWAGGVCVGIAVMLTIAATVPDPEPKIVKVPVVQVVEKPVIVKEAVYVNSHDRQQIQCLAENAYFEAGNQPTKGMIAVTNVVMNRTKDDRFPSTPCAVVKQKRGGVCQFSWVCEGKKRIRDAVLFRKTKDVAEDVYLKNVGDVTHGAKFYHADYVRPRWAYVFDRTTKIGAHIFYRG